MRRFIFITQVVDPEHPALGATVAKIRESGEACGRSRRACSLCGAGLAPTELSGSHRGRGFTSRTRLAARVRPGCGIAPRPVAVLAHMAPIYGVLAAPLCRTLRVPLLLWYTHWHTSRLLVVAERVSNVVVSVDVRSFPLPSAKVIATGHGIDLDEFPCVERSHDRGLRLLSLGRYSQAKGIDTVLRAVATRARCAAHPPRAGLDAGGTPVPR